MRKKPPLLITAACTALSCAWLPAQGPRPGDLGASPQAIGDAGVAWYTTWDTTLLEAQRSNRPIFFMAAAATCDGISGVFWPGYTSTQNGLFSQKEFIGASRKFVCVRLESYESEEHQQMVRSFLDGRFENTAFCLLAPDGKERLSRTGRAPWMAFGGRGPRGGNSDAHKSATIDAMEKVASQYKPTGDPSQAVVQDFHSFRQSLNVASGDQRLLLYVAVPEDKQGGLRKKLSKVMGDKEIIGRFHTDFFSEDSDEKWADSIDGEKPKNGLLIIQSDKFGQKGRIIKQLPSKAKPAKIKSALLSANQSFAEKEERKVYSDHVADGRREQIHFENAMPYGEDRDGDGEIDHRGGRGPGPGGRGRPPGGRRPGRGGPPQDKAVPPRETQP